MKKLTKVSSMLLLLLMTAWTQMFAQGLFVQEKALKVNQLQNGMRIAFKAIAGDNSNWVNWSGVSTTTPAKNGIFILEAAADSKWKLKRESDGQYIQHNGNEISFVDATQATALTVSTPDITSTANINLPSWAEKSDGYQIRFSDDTNHLNTNNSTGIPSFGTGTGAWSMVMVYNAEGYDASYPFILSEAPSADGFAENTVWYYLKLNNRYLSYNDEVENYNYKQTNYKEQKYVYSYDSNPLTYGCFWAFVKDGEDLKIYNAATGASMVLASDGSDERDYYPTMMAPNTEGYTDRWHYNIAKDPTKFYLYLQGTDYAQKANKLNCYAGDMTSTSGGNPKNYLTFSVGDGDWSYFTVEPVDVTAAINSVRETQEAITGAVGALNSDAYKQFTEALNEGNIYGLVTALKIKDNDENKIPFVTDGYYRLRSANETSKYMIIQNNGGSATEFDNQNATEIWKLASTNEADYYNLYCQGMYLNAATAQSGSLTSTKDQASASTFTLVEGTKTASFRFDPKSGYEIHWNQGSLVGWNGGTGSSWYIIPVTTIETEITSAGYATVNYPFAVQLPKELTAYTGTANAEKSKFILEEVPGGAVPANTPVVIQGPKGIHTLAINYENAAEPISRDLSGSLLPIEILPDDYILAKNSENVVGFYKTTDGGTLAQNKAYIKSTPAIQAVRGFGFSTEGDGTTGIENTVTETENEEYYDLQGRRVMNPTKGIYVTKNGKKVLFVK